MLNRYKARKRERRAKPVAKAEIAGDALIFDDNSLIVLVRVTEEEGIDAEGNKRN